jgi:hypothetical protein
LAQWSFVYQKWTKVPFSACVKLRLLAICSFWPCHVLTDWFCPQMRTFALQQHAVDAGASEDAIADALDSDNPKVRKRWSFFAPFIYKMHYFTKTGSGQT